MLCQIQMPSERSTKVQKLHIESVSDSFQSAACEYLKPCS